MAELEKVIKGLECCVGSKKVDECGWEDGDYKECPYNGNANGCVFRLMKDALSLLKAQEQRHRLEVHNIGNVDIPEGVTEEQFHAVMNNVVEALEHTDKGESWPYEPPKEET